MVVALGGAAAPAGAAEDAIGRCPAARLDPPADAAQPPGVRARFMGTTTILLEDGVDQILLDGFFSRPRLSSVIFRKIGPDPSRIKAGLARARITRLSAVLTAHAHYDHALDAPDVAEATGAPLVGSASVANIALGRGFPAARIRTITGGETLCFGRFTIRAVAAPHSPAGRLRGWLFDGAIPRPLASPARAWAYKEGGNFSYLVEHGGTRILLHPSANSRPDLFQDMRADVVFLGLGGLGGRDEDRLETYWREVVGTTGPTTVIPVHWDNFWRPPDQPLKPPPRPFADHAGAMRVISRLARHDGVTILSPPPFEALDLPGPVATAR